MTDFDSFPPPEPGADLSDGLPETSQSAVAVIEPPRPARAGSAQLALMFVVATIVLALDQVTKRWIEANLPLYDSMPVLNLAPYFQFTHTTNTGAAFGILQSAGNLFGIIAVIVGIAIVIYNFQLPPGHLLLRFALGMQLGGAFGNLVDRLRQGHVTDFLHADFSSLIDVPLANVPLFNIADASIVSGVILLGFIMIMEQVEPESAPEALTPTVAPVMPAPPTRPLVSEPDESY